MAVLSPSILKPELCLLSPSNLLAMSLIPIINYCPGINPQSYDYGVLNVAKKCPLLDQNTKYPFQNLATPLVDLFPPGAKLTSVHTLT